MHAHHFMQFGFSQSPVFKVDSGAWEKSKELDSFFVPSDVSHSVTLTGGANALMVWLDPEFSSDHSFAAGDAIHYPLDPLKANLQSFLDKPLNCKTASKIREVITGRSSIKKATELDGRISKALDWVASNLTKQTITTKQLAQMVYLSPSRFMHLFSDQIGIPVRRYILWQRLRHVLITLADGTGITQSAHEAGFTDAPHMNRTFNAMFGITPSKIFKNSRFIQVIAC